MPLRRALPALAAAGFVLVCLVPAPATSADPPTIKGPNRVFTTEGSAITFTGLNPRAGLDSNNDPEKLDIVVDLETAGCAPAPGNGYSLSGCSSLTIGADVAEGALSMPYSAINGQGSVVGQTAAGAFVANYAAGQIRLNGTNTQLNDSLKTLKWTPVAGYENDDETTSEITLLGSNAVGSASVNEYIQVRVDDENQPMTLTVPGDQTMDTVVDGQTKSFPAVAPPVGTNGLWFVEDPDIDEGDPSLGLLVNVATCGKVELRNQLTIQGGLVDVLRGYVDDLHNGDDTDAGYVALRDGFVDLLVGALPDDVKNAPFETGPGNQPHAAWAGIGTKEEINYALSQVTFHAPATVPDTCDVVTVVSDLGNDGLPFQYVGSPLSDGDNDDPELPEPGLELPEPSLDLVDFDTVTIDVDGGAAMVSLPPTLSVPEGTDLAIPVTVDGGHPAFAVSLQAADVSTEGALDYSAPTDATFAAAAGAGSANGTLSALTDAVSPEGDETLTVTLDEGDLPDGVILDESAASTTVTITDVAPDPGGDTTRPSVTITPAAAQGSPTSVAPIRFTAQFSEAVTGFDATDPQLGASTAGGPLVSTVIPVDSDTYTVEVTGMSASGDVVASLLANAATRPRGQPELRAAVERDRGVGAAAGGRHHPPDGDGLTPGGAGEPDLGGPGAVHRAVQRARLRVQRHRPAARRVHRGRPAGRQRDPRRRRHLHRRGAGDERDRRRRPLAARRRRHRRERQHERGAAVGRDRGVGPAGRRHHPALRHRGAPGGPAEPDVDRPGPVHRAVQRTRLRVQRHRPPARRVHRRRTPGRHRHPGRRRHLHRRGHGDERHRRRRPLAARRRRGRRRGQHQHRAAVARDRGVGPAAGRHHPALRHRRAPGRVRTIPRRSRRSGSRSSSARPSPGSTPPTPSSPGPPPAARCRSTVIPVDADTYTVEVTGMSATGDVVLSLLADAAVDGSGNTSTAPPSAATVGMGAAATGRHHPAVGDRAAAAGPAEPDVGGTGPVHRAVQRARRRASTPPTRSSSARRPAVRSRCR